MYFHDLETESIEVTVHTYMYQKDMNHTHM